MVNAVDRCEPVELPSPAPRLTGSGRWRRPLAIVAALIGVPLALVLTALVVVAALALTGTSVDVSHWRDAVGQRLAAALGRPVLLQGALEVEPTLGREVGLHVGSLRILNPPGFAGPEFLAVSELRVRIDLLAALRGRFRAGGIEAREVDLRLERRADGAANWTASSRRDASSQPAPFDIAGLTLRGLRVHYQGANSPTPRALELDELSGSAGWDRPLRVTARGRWESGLAYSATVEGGALRLLDDGTEAWPFTLEGSAPGARLHAWGALDARQGTGQLNVDARADDLAAIERLVGASLARFGRASVQCAVRVAGDAVEVGNLHATLGESELGGQLALSLDGARPRLRGALSAAALDLGPVLTAPPPADAAGGGNLRALTALDAEVDLKVERWLGLGVEVRDASFAWRADARGLRVPASATIASIPLAGVLELDTSSPTPTLVVRLEARKARLGELAHGLGLASGVDGAVGRVRLRIDSRGDSTETLARDAAFSLALVDAQLRSAGTAGAEPVTVSIDSLDLSAHRGERVRGRARGSLEGTAATLEFRGGTLLDVLQQRAMPLELDLTLGQARLRADGRISAAEPPYAADLRFNFHAARVGDLARWLGISPQAGLPVAMRGRARVEGAAWALDKTTLELGSSRLTVDAHSSRGEGRPAIAVQVRGALLDANELASLRAAGASRRTAQRDAAADVHDVTAFPDADLDIQLQRLRLARAEFEDLALLARFREGRLQPSALTGKVDGAAFTANVEADTRARPPLARIALSTGEIDLGALLHGLGVAEDIDGRVQALQFDAVGRGGTPGEWAGQSSFDLRLRGGNLAVRGAAQSTLAEIRVDEGRLGAGPGEPLRAHLDGAIGRTPVTIEATSGTLAELAADADHVPFTLSARAAGTQLALHGAVSLPLGSGGQLNLEMRGERLDSLSPLARVELPAWGPWSFSSPIHMTAAGYELPQLQARVAGSELVGRAAVDLSNPRPALTLQLAAPRIQLDDFPLPERLTDSPEDRPTARQTASALAGRTDRLLSAAFLRRLDATIDVKANEVLSGDDRLADGSLRVKLDGGHLDLDPVVVNIPGGAMRLSVSYELNDSEVEFGMAARIDRFDYGVIAHRYDRTSHLRGLLTLDMALFGKGPTLENITRNASGRVDFAVWPVELSGEAFNLWSVNLLLQLLPLIDPNTRPTVNCIVGRFDLEHGDLRHDKMLIDTSAVRVSGTGHANLATEQLDFVFRPRAKGFAVFRLQTPLRVTGTLDDRRFGFTRTDVVESALRLVASPILLPIERLTLGPLPRDGADVCTDPLRTTAP